MLILIEGDSSGATAQTLSDEIRRLHPDDSVTIVHPDPRHTSPLRRFTEPFLGYRPRPRMERSGVRGWVEVPLCHIIFDGWFKDDLIIPSVGGTSDVIDPGTAWYLDMFAHSRGAYGVRVRKDGEAPAPWTAHRASGATMGRSTLKRTEHFTHTRPSTWAHDVIAQTQAQANIAFVLRGIVTYVGRPNPYVLMLGSSRPSSEGTHSPAFMPHHGSPGRFLSDAIAWTVPQAPFIGVGNACDSDNLEHMIDMHSPRIVVPLGNRSFSAYEKLPHSLTRDIRMFTMPHPVEAARVGDDSTYARRVRGYGLSILHGINRASSR